MIEQVKVNFTQIPNRIIDDKEVSDKAKVVYIKMRRCGTDWAFSIRGLAKQLGKSSGSVAHALRELEEKGYIERFQTRDRNSRFSRMEYRVFNDPHTDTSHTEESHTQDLNGKEHYDNNTIGINTIHNTDYLTVDMRAFERFFNRHLMPSEKEIWERWKHEKVDSRLIKIAVEDNEYRMDRLTLEHVDATLKGWAKEGIMTPVDANNTILEAKYLNTKYKMGADPRSIAVVDCIGAGDLRQWKDALIREHKEKDPMIKSDAFCCPIDVFKYLPKDVLLALITLYEANHDNERLAAAKETLTELWEV
ncbi:MAG: DnaD domain protein [Clostridiales bacterium]|nr:DnaD domain protein [Clostridiales bacterium]